ncbi:aspartate aminotransferase family protein [Bdellovibrionota bacterium FG-1]
MSHDKIRTNEELVSFRKKHFLPTAGLYHQEPIHLVKAQGQYVWDTDGKRYLDAIGGIVCISVGHNHPKIKKALVKMLEADTLQHTSLLYLSEPVVEAAESLLKEAPTGLDRVSFTNSGSEANELAIMAARNATGETTVVNLRHSYHGGTSGTLAQCGHASWRFRAQPVANATSAMEPNCYRCPFGQKLASCALECAKNVETTIQTSTHGKIAAFIAEPVMGVGGFIAPPDDYFKTVSKIVQNYGGKYISDEVQTGAGRCGGRFLLTTELGFEVDMVTMAKGFGNGAAVGAVLMKTEVAEKMSGKAYFNTFAGDPYQMMQTKLTMDIIREEKLIENARAMGAILRDGLTQMMKKHLLMGDVRGRGLLLGVELVKDRNTKVHATAECVRFMDLCKERGLLLGKGGLMGNVVRIAPPISINQEQIHSMLEIMDQSFSALEKERHS